MAPSICVNLYKSKLFGINLEEFLEVASTFLACGIESIPFIFFEIPVGDHQGGRIHGVLYWKILEEYCHCGNESKCLFGKGWLC